jgi:hypothetical protein
MFDKEELQIIHDCLCNCADRKLILGCTSDPEKYKPAQETFDKYDYLIGKVLELLEME